MPEGKITTPQGGALRKRAEEIFRGKAAGMAENVEALSPDETRQLVHELHVHQIELEMQNEELRQAQLELSEARTRYFDLYDLAPVGYCTISEKGLILEANLTAATMLGLTHRGALAKRPLSQYIFKEDHDINYLHLKQLFETDEPQAYELRMLKKDRLTFWARLETAAALDSDGSSMYRVVMSDITLLKRSEEMLRESEEKYRNLYRHSALGIFHSNFKDRFTDVNPALARMLGYDSPEEAVSLITNISEQVYAKPHKRDEATNKVLEAGGFVSMENSYLRSDGTLWYGMLHLRLVCDQKGKPSYYEGFVEDITARKKVEEERKQLELQRQQLQKTESLGRMAGAIAHHFNNQLGVVIGNLELAIDDLPQGAGAINSLTTAMQAAGKAAEMNGLMLAYLGQTSGKRQTLDLSEACLQSLPIIRVTIPNDVIMETDLTTPGPVISANANHIQQVLTNLVNNAWESVGEDGGSINLGVKMVPAANIPELYRFPMDWQPQNNAYACLEVIDNGCGIDDKDVEKLFDPFFSSKFTGRGMGLAVVLGIVRAHGGVVTVESEQGRGSVFRVFLPVSTEEVSRHPYKAVQAPAVQEDGTVLLVEDEDMVRNMARSMLMRLGFSVLEAKDGVDAVEVFRQHRDEIRFVISDLTMPRMNGWETLATLRKIAPDLPVILASGYDVGHVMAGDHPELPQAFLGKPYRIKGLRDAIKQALINKKE